MADADIDADGANGQNGASPAYKVDDSGTELLANGGMKIVHGKVICAVPGARDIVILDSDNEPKVFPGGVIASMTWVPTSRQAGVRSGGVRRCGNGSVHRCATGHRDADGRSGARGARLA
jgi:hypothetical protein